VAGRGTYPRKVLAVFMRILRNHRRPCSSSFLWRRCRGARVPGDSLYSLPWPGGGVSASWPDPQAPPRARSPNRARRGVVLDSVRPAATPKSRIFHREFTEICFDARITPRPSRRRSVVISINRFSSHFSELLPEWSLFMAANYTALEPNAGPRSFDQQPGNALARAESASSAACSQARPCVSA